MKKLIEEKRKRGEFLNKPEYQGGNKAFEKFIQENLKYPDEAIENKIEGFVLLNAKVDDNGNVIEAKVVKGLGYGCDEEALRLAKLVKYNKVKNRGLRVITSKKIRIIFYLPKETKQTIESDNQILTYTITSSKNVNPGKNINKNNPTNQTYGYTLNW